MGWAMATTNAKEDGLGGFYTSDIELQTTTFHNDVQ